MQKDRKEVNEHKFIKKLDPTEAEPRNTDSVINKDKLTKKRF
ncbi:hypothetical protein CTRC122_03640 [Chlamydia trachomatis RC-J(s)/122]|nr:hypothetical protein CTRC122_03640 [Chlamydia trachomatis RC-J(s)/122]AGS02505.1 hypothetical protein CTJTET1_03635 [Chlamydia trachomatis J/6276tet1]AGT71386.1 hypothetical protein O178_03780 [Chlamydia trachomatis]AGT73225.1 hypothetical protein O180_03765 [Chlamydia trachomatis]